MMNPKENLIFEMQNLNKTLCRYLIKLCSEEIDDVAYLDINDGCGSVLLALKKYFGDNPYNFDNWDTALLTPDD